MSIGIVLSVMTWTKYKYVVIHINTDINRPSMIVITNVIPVSRQIYILYWDGILYSNSY